MKSCQFVCVAFYIARIVSILQVKLLQSQREREMDLRICFIMEFFVFFLILLARTSESSLGYDYNPLYEEATFDVMKFGATGNGQTDDSKAFQSAWQAACHSDSNSVTLIVPSGRRYLIFPIRFEGPCKSNYITFKILGTIVAPPKSAWTKKVDEWLCFHEVNGLKIVGDRKGSIDGQGHSWWNGASDDDRPTAVRFSHCENLQVNGLNHINSQKNHVSITSCNHAIISRLRMIAPSNSPNTDGIDIGHSTNIIINNCIMKTGDDCIAINGGTSNVSISHVTCGPGHGISIGSLGKHEKDINTVEGVHVYNCTFKAADNGVRIKTWPRGEGFVKNIRFTDIHFINTDNPVIINQHYCPHKTCKDNGSKIKISDVTYNRLRGTSICKNSTITIGCSDLVPCTNIIVDSVDIKPVNSDIPSTAECDNAYGEASNCINPSVDCLKA